MTLLRSEKLSDGTVVQPALENVQAGGGPAIVKIDNPAGASYLDRTDLITLRNMIDEALA